LKFTVSCEINFLVSAFFPRKQKKQNELQRKPNLAHQKMVAGNQTHWLKWVSGGLHMMRCPLKILGNSKILTAFSRNT